MYVREGGVYYLLCPSYGSGHRAYSVFQCSYIFIAYFFYTLCLFGHLKIRQPVEDWFGLTSSPSLRHIMEGSTTEMRPNATLVRKKFRFYGAYNKKNLCQLLRYE